MKFPEWLKVYGDIKYRGKCPTENAEQVTFFNSLSDDIRRIAIHPRNEGKRTLQQAQRHKAEGMTPGAADIIILGSPSFVCELKRQDHTKSVWQPDQQQHLIIAQDNGAFVCVALGWVAAREAFEEWNTIRMIKNG
jgi:hypothetical protein